MVTLRLPEDPCCGTNSLVPRLRASASGYKLFIKKRHLPHVSFVVWLSAPSCATLRTPSPAHLTASIKCSTVKDELHVVAGDCAVSGGVAGGTQCCLCFCDTNLLYCSRASRARRSSATAVTRIRHRRKVPPVFRTRARRVGARWQVFMNQRIPARGHPPHKYWRCVLCASNLPLTIYECFREH